VGSVELEIVSQNRKKESPTIDSTSSWLGSRACSEWGRVPERGKKGKKEASTIFSTPAQGGDGGGGGSRSKFQQEEMMSIRKGNRGKAGIAEEQTNSLQHESVYCEEEK